MDPHQYESLRNKTLLFFIEKLIDLENIECKKRTLHDLSCQFGSKGFTKEMRQIAGGSQSGLKKFLLEYPSIFKIDGDLVTYKDTSYSNLKQESENDYGKEAVEYFRERLLQYGINVWVPIKSLLGHRSQAPTEVRHVSGQHISEFRDFLARFPEVFKLNLDSVMLKEFEQEPVESIKIDKEQILKLLEFYGNCLGERGPMLVEQLYHAGCNIDTDFVKGPSDLRSFFQMHPKCFQVHSNMVSTNSTTFRIALEHYKQSINKPEKVPTSTYVSVKPINKIETIPEPVQENIKPETNTFKSRFSKILMKTLTENSNLEQPNNVRISDENKFEELCNAEEEILKNYLVNRTLIVANLRKGKVIVDEILNRKDVVSIDCEGVNLGDCASGKITLIQVGNLRGAVFVFDVLTQPGLISEVRRVLEDETVLKVMHDCRNDSVNLYREFGIRLRGVFDTQAAHIVIQQQKTEESKIKNISLNNLCHIYYDKVQNPFKDKIKGVYRHDQRFWSRRPLTKQMIAYASCDVLCLVPYVYSEMNKRIVDEEDKRLLAELTEEQILAHIQPDEIRQRRRMRKNESDLGELKVKIEGAIVDDNSSLVLSNREMRLLKHLELSDLAKEKLKTSLKVAKKLEKMERMSSTDPGNDNNSSTTSSEMTSLEYNNNNEINEVDNRIQQIDNLEAIISNIITSGGGGKRAESDFKAFHKKDIGVQTASTGDVVVMKIYEDKQEEEP